jgi:hypothetical protein
LAIHLGSEDWVCTT